MACFSRGIKVKRLVFGAVVLVWASATGAALAHFWRYAATPGAAASAVPERIAASQGKSRVRVFLDARCPCSRATVAELARVAARLSNPTEFQVLFAAADESDSSWKSSSLYEDVSRLPGVTVFADVGGARARSYGIATSGQVLAYRPDGTLAFAGGVTGSRGHEGDNDGKSQLLAALDASSASPRREATTTAVYGCELPVYSTEILKELP